MKTLDEIEIQSVPIIDFAVSCPLVLEKLLLNEPPHGKTNNVVSEQFRHKPCCTSIEAG